MFLMKEEVNAEMDADFISKLFDRGSDLISNDEYFIENRDACLMREL